MNDWYKSAFWFVTGGITAIIVMFIITMVAVVINPAAFH